MRSGIRAKMGSVMRSAGLPEEAVTGAARLTMIGRCRVRIENHCGLVELTQERIRLRTREGMVRIEGSGLQLRELTLHTAEIEGEIRETQQ